jgi:hypothetical protein
MTSCCKRGVFEFEQKGTYSGRDVGAPRRITDAQVDEVIIDMLETQPRDVTDFARPSCRWEAFKARTDPVQERAILPLWMDGEARE